MKIKICVSVGAKTIPELIQRIEEAEYLGADFIEVRLDHLRVIGEVRRIAQSTPVSLIATNRRLDQGGRRPQNERRRIKTLLEASECGFEFVDIEYTTPDLQEVSKSLRDLGSDVIVSYHDFNGTPSLEELEEKVDLMRSQGAHICKVVTTAKEVSDNITSLRLIKEVGKEVRIVCFAMGEKGLLSRLLSPLVGGYYAYASLGDGLETAPGQIDIQTLRKFYEIMGV